MVFCFLLAFLAGCGFIAAYIGLGVHTVDKVFRSNLALGLSLSVALLSLGLGALIWVRQLMPDVELAEERHEMRSTRPERAAFQEYFEEGAAASQFVRRPMVRRTLMLATLPLAVIPIVAAPRHWVRCPAPACGTPCGVPGRRLLVYGTNTPLTPAEFSAPGSMITIVPDGYQDDPDALAKAAVILIKFRPGELQRADDLRRQHADQHDELDGRELHRRLLQDLHPRGLPGRRCTSRPRTTSCVPATSRRSRRRRVRG